MSRSPFHFIRHLTATALITTALAPALAEAVLPAATVAETAVKQALAKPAPAPAQPAKNNAAELRQKGVQQAPKAKRNSGRSAVVRATAYNSVPGQTDSTPFITATGTRTRFGVVALSRDLLQRFPYGTRVRLEDLSGRYNGLLANKVFVVEDTMNRRWRNKIDIWMSSRSQAMQWGARDVRITAIE